MRHQIRIKTVTLLSCFTALAMVLSYLEFLLPPVYATVPGIKMGLCNIVIIFVLYRFSLAHAAAVSAVRLVLSALLFGTALTFVYSLSGAVFSLIVMALFKKSNRFTMVGVSIAGGVIHNLAQTVTAMLLLNTRQIGYYMIFLTVAGVISGMLVGLSGAFLVKRTQKFKF